MDDKLGPLKPLDAKAQDEFDRRRETASVVQHKCLECGAWYETPKRATAYREVFVCDCGAPMSFLVPAIDASKQGLGDLDDRLESGMKIRDALANASYWWGKTGRHMMKKHDAKAEAVFASADPNSENFMPSGIVNGEPWDNLDLRERLFLVKSWHYHFIWKPQKEG